MLGTIVPPEFKCIMRHPEAQNIGAGIQHSRHFLEDDVCEEGFWPWLITKGYLQFNAVGRKKKKEKKKGRARIVPYL